MKMSAVIRELVAAGLSVEEIADAVERIEASAGQPEDGVKATEAARTARYRERRNMDEGMWASVRLHILERDNHVCSYCGAHATQCDHIVPLARGGTNDPDNLTAACSRCNASKAARLLTEWRGPPKGGWK